MMMAITPTAKKPGISRTPSFLGHISPRTRTHPHPHPARYEPHKNKWYKPYDNHLRIYEQTAANLPKAAAERAAKLAENIHGKKGRGSSPQEINTRVKAHHDTVSVKQNFPKSVVGEGDEVTVVTTVTHSTSAAQKKKEG